jgi:hypothetical protein
MVSDESLYPEDQYYVSKNQVVGWVKGYIPYVGWVAISLQEWREISLKALKMGGVQGYVVRFTNWVPARAYGSTT